MNDFLDNAINRRHPITLIGEILIDEIHNVSSSITSVHCGGSPANIALNLVDLGLKDIQFAGTVGNDIHGRQLLKNLEDNHLSIQNIHVSDHQTSFVKINQTGGTPYPTFYREADYHIQMTDRLRDTISNSSILHFSYWPLSKEPARSTILEAVQIAKEKNVLVGFDPNYHTLLEGDLDISEDSMKQLMKHIDIIKPSYDDAQRMFGGQETPETYLQKFADLGIRLIVMTLGKDGLICRQGDTIVRLPSMADDVIDATGAGDAFLSGLYSALLHDEDLTTSLKMGLVCSAYNLKQVGGRSHLPHYDTLRQIIVE